MYDKNQIEDSLAFVRRMKDIYGQSDETEEASKSSDELSPQKDEEEKKNQELRRQAEARARARAQMEEEERKRRENAERELHAKREDEEIERLKNRVEELERQAEVNSLKMRIHELESGESVSENAIKTRVMPIEETSEAYIPAPVEKEKSKEILKPVFTTDIDTSSLEKSDSDESGFSLDELFAKELEKTQKDSGKSEFKRRELFNRTIEKHKQKLKEKRENETDGSAASKVFAVAGGAKKIVSDGIDSIREVVEYRGVDTEHTAERSRKKKYIINLCVILLCIMAAYVLAAVVTTFVAHPTKVEGNSMEPTLKEGDTIIVQKMAYAFSKPKRYDVIVFPVSGTKDTYYIKRIIALPGEAVKIDDGKVFVNGKELTTDKYGKEKEISDPGDAVDEMVLGKDEYFVLGDNRNFSLDSRSDYVGLIPRKTITGKAVSKLWPKMGAIK